MTYPISRYLNVQQATYPSFSADGRCLAFLSDITGMAQVWQVDLAQVDEAIPWPDQLTFAADRVLSVQYSPIAGDNRLLYSHDLGGNENAQLFLLDTGTGEEFCLTDGYDEAMHIPGEWSADGRFFLFAANRRHRALFDLYLQPLDGGAARLVWQNEAPGFLTNLVFSPDGRRAVVSRMASSFSHDLFQVNLATGEVQQLSPPDKEARYPIARYSRDGRSLYLTSDRDSDFLHLAQLDLATLTWETLVAPNGDIELLALSPNGRYLATVVNKAGRGELELIDLSMSLARTVPMASDVPGIIGWADGRLVFSADSNRLAFSYTSAVRTSDVYVWNLDLNRDDVRPVTRSSHGGIPVDRFAAPELIHYPTFDDREIPAWFYRPQKPDFSEKFGFSLPVVVIVHGGPESQFRPNFNFLAQYLVHCGYAVFAPNVRGSTGYGKTYSHLDDVEKRMDSVTDLAYAARWLGARPEIDGGRIVVYGGSYGGFMVLAALTHYPDLWAAGVDIVGISNLATFLENTSHYRRAHREAEYGRLDHERDFLESIAPMNHVDKIKVPLMVIHGANDPRVPLSEAEQLVTALRRRNVPVEFLVFDDEGHGIAKLKNKRVAYPAVVNFLDRVVAAAESSNQSAVGNKNPTGATKRIT
jgi:dipeptidyl aminopeptidase/acylaminoacyl peptidase